MLGQWVPLGNDRHKGSGLVGQGLKPCRVDPIPNQTQTKQAVLQSLNDPAGFGTFGNFDHDEPVGSQPQEICHVLNQLTRQKIGGRRQVHGTQFAQLGSADLFEQLI